MSAPMRRLVLAMFAAAIVAVSGAGLAKEKAGKPKPPPSKHTQVIRAETYKRMEASQKAFEAKNYADAVAALDAIKAREQKLNDYERATLYSLYASIAYAQEKLPEAIAAYRKVLEQPNLPEGLRDSSLYALAQLYFISGDHARTVSVIKQWSGVATTPSPEGQALMAQAYYQMQKYAEAEAAVVASLRITRDRKQAPKESALALLRAIHYERKDYARAAKVLEVLVAQFPGKSTYWQQLAGMQGLLERQRQQVTILHAAHRGRLVGAESDVLNLARLYMVQGAPYAAARLIAQGLSDERIQPNAQNLELYAQALALSREYDKQIPVLEKLSRLSGQSRHFLYLGQAYIEVGRWKDAAGAFRAALKRPGADGEASIHMQLGAALFNAGELVEARQHFFAASRAPLQAVTAANWVKFVDSELQRRDAVKELRG